MDWGWLLGRDEVASVRHLPGAAGVHMPWPDWLPPGCVASIVEGGIREPWRHQVEFAEAAHGGSHAAICTPTGSGKTLAYLMPVLAATADGAAGTTPATRTLRRVRPTALYLAPTKALAHDQYRAVRQLGPRGWSVATLDGDSEASERQFARTGASLVLTNPDMLHYSVLPNHQAWAGLLSGLRYIIVDEAHRYQGLFGSHVSAVLRRLRRLGALYGANPVLLLSSATAPNAATFAADLIGDDVAVFNVSSAPRGDRTVALWRPVASLNHDASELLAGLCDQGTRTLAFTSSRTGAELVALGAQELAASPRGIASYRAGYLPQDRRTLEAALQSGALTALATTNALELGVDVSGLDAVLVVGYPGRLSSLWQQLGRAGRSGGDSLGVLLASQNPLDAYLLAHPELVFDEPVENAVLHPGNPHVLGPHLAAAAQEHPLTAADERWFGPLTPRLVEHLTAQGVLRRRGDGWFWTRPDRAVDFINLRSSDPAPIEIIERETGRVLGVVDHGAADRTVHPGAVHLHQGETWTVVALDEAENRALVTATRSAYYTQALTSLDIAVVAELGSRCLGVTKACFGEVRITSLVTGYLRRDEVTHDVLDATELDMPERTLRTQAVWWTVPEELTRRLRWPPLRMGAAVHAAEHAAIGLLPLFAPCDRWDIGGISTAMHPDTGAPTVFVHDGAVGGAGFAARAFEVAGEWLAATLERLETCGCEAGCPACVVSPKCGNANQVLDKADAAVLLRGLLAPGVGG